MDTINSIHTLTRNTSQYLNTSLSARLTILHVNSYNGCKLFR